MTENEAIKELKDYRACSGTEFPTEIEMAIQALEEIQLYRAIGLSPELIEAMQGHNIALINDLGEYQAIGTVEEFKALKEKTEPKKVDEDFCCPICHTCGTDDNGVAGEYCPNCGQKLDWE